MTTTETRGSDCPEYAELSRRGFLRAAGLTGLAGTTSVTFGSTFVQTAYADPAYYAARPRIAVPSSTLLAKDGMFGLHPSLAPLLPMWQAGRLAAVHGTGLPAVNRSHFAAMELVEDADPGSSARVGWLNRLLGRDDHSHPLQAVQLGGSVVPTSLYGPQPVLAAHDLDGVGLSGSGGADSWRTRSMHTIWDRAGGPLGRGARSALQSIADFAPVQATSETPANGATYPSGDLGRALQAAARTIRGDVGAEVITVDHGSWDLHTGLGTLEWGFLVGMARTLAEAIAAFFTDLGPLADKVTLVTLSEFGRRVRENANYGLDHGHGTVMFLAGAGVRGGYHGTLPPLVDSDDADVPVTTDYRSVLSEIVVSRFDTTPATVFPGFQPARVGVMQGQ